MGVFISKDLLLRLVILPLQLVAIWRACLENCKRRLQFCYKLREILSVIIFLRISLRFSSLSRRYSPYEIMLHENESVLTPWTKTTSPARVHRAELDFDKHGIFKRFYSLLFNKCSCNFFRLRTVDLSKSVTTKTFMFLLSEMEQISY